MKFLNVIGESLLEDYRQSDRVNYSLLKEVVDGNYTVIRDGLPQKTSTYMDYGSYIDHVVTEGEEPKDLYIYKHCEPTGHSEKLINALLEFNKPDASIETRLKFADKLKLWSTTKNPEKRAELVDSEVINTILDREIARKNGANVISEEDLEIAKKVLNVLYTHEYSKDIVNPPLKVESYTQLALKFKFNKVDCKVLLDFLQVNHKDKTLQPIDLKTGSKKDFLKNYWGYKYWLQGTLYYLAIFDLINKYKELKDYKILPFKFLYISRERSNVPLKFELSERSVKKYTEGYFDHRNQYQKGVIDYLNEYKFHKETGIYDVNKEEYDNKGVIALPEPY